MEQDRQAWAIYQLMQDKEQWELIHQFLKDYLYNQTNRSSSADRMVAIKDTIEAIINKGNSYGREE